MLLGNSPRDADGTTGEDQTADAENAERADLVIDAPEQSYADEAIAVQVRGAPPEARVEFEAVATDADGGEWTSSATFVADAEGVVDLSRDAPETGTYDGVRPMGWLWSMAAEGDQLVTALMDADPTSVRLRASAGGSTTERTITRVVVGDGATRTDVEDERVVGTLYEPAGDGPNPGVLALHGSGGQPLHYHAALLARHGFAAFAVRYFGSGDPIPGELEKVPLEYFDTAATWLRGREGVADAPLGVLGHSFGGLLGLLLGSRHDWVGAVASYAGSGVVWDTPDGTPAWVEDGDSVPHVSGQGKPTLLEGQLDAASERRRREATIPVERVDGPVLLISGREDPVWPATRLSEIATDRLRERDFAYTFEHRDYEDAGHFITPPYLPKRAPAFEGTPGGIARADADAWPRVLDWFETSLRGDTGE